MRPLLVASVVLALIAGSACEHCSCASTKLPLQALLTDSDAGSVIPMSDHVFGVELAGSGRKISVSDPTRLGAQTPPFQPDGMTFETFTPMWINTPGSAANGGFEVLTSPAQKSQPSWRATVIIEAHPGYFPTVVDYVTVGQSQVYTWPLGGQPPSSSNTGVYGPYGPAVVVTSAIADLKSMAITVNEPYLEQMYYAVAPGKVTFTPPFTRPLATNESLEGQQVIVKFNPDWTCSVESGCSQTHLNSQNPSP